jgi:DNA helicase II / ATP-dependent DNA helicase PcrA
VSKSPPSISSKTLPQPAFADDLAPADRERVRRQLELYAAARWRLPQDPFPHYLAHCRIARPDADIDVLFTSGDRSRRTRAVREGLIVADFAESAYAATLFGAREGQRGEANDGGTLLERHVVGYEGRELADIATVDGLLTRRGGGVWRRVPSLPLHVFERRSAALLEHPPSLIDVHLDPAQRRVVELPPGRSVLVLGEAGHGKTTVALHRLARLAQSAKSGRFRVAVLVPSVGLERLIDPLLSSLRLDIDVRVFERWALEQMRRAFPGLARRVSETTTASVIRFKRDPALRVALAAIAERRPGRIDDQRERAQRRAPPTVSRGDLQHLFGDRALVARVLSASRDPIGPHGVAELLEHTRIQFSRSTEHEYAHVDRARLRTIDGRPIDAGTPLEDAGSIDAEDCAVVFEIDRLRAERRQRPATAPASFDCIVLDEAQEFAPIELTLVGRSLAPGGTLIVAGDADQQTDPAAFFGGWEHTMAALGVTDYERVTLGVNYRCPPKVVRVAKRLVSSSALSPPAARVAADREAPFLEFLNEAQLGLWLVGELREIQRHDRRASAAVICRTPATAKRITRLLRHALDARLVLDGAFAYESGVNVTTVDHVKGLEFDYVVVPDASKTNYPNQPSARRALYVAVTRSRHELALGSVTERTPLLPDTLDTAT